MKFGRAMAYVLTAVAALYFIVAAIVLFTENGHPFGIVAQKSRSVLQTGNEATSVAGRARFGSPHEGTLELRGADGASASAEWNVSIGLFAPILRGADVLRSEIVVDAVSAGAPRAGASLTARFPGSAKPVALAGAGEPRFADSPVQLATTQTEILAVAPLPRTELSRAGVLPIRVTARGLNATIRRVGVYFVYAPTPASPWNRAGFVVPLAVVETIAALLALGAAFRTLRCVFGAWTAPVMAAVAAVSAVTQDNWDFSLWIHFIDVVYCGGASPVGDWSATPLWAFIPTLVTPIVALAPLLHVPLLVVETVALKGFFTLAFFATWTSLAELARRADVAPLRPVVAAAPFCLYMLAFGARDVFALSLVLMGLLCASRRPYGAAACFAAGISVSEYLAPFFLLPLLLALERGASRTAVARGALASALSVALVAVQWIFLEAAQRHGVLAFRIDSVMFAGATWTRLLSMQHIADGVERAEVLHACYAAYVAGGLALFARAVRRLRDGTDALRAATEFAVPASLLFFFCYRGVDPQEWYGPVVLFAAAACVLRRSFIPTAAVSIFAFVTTYSFSGFRAYLSPAFAAPSVDSLFWRDPGIMNAYTAVVLAFLAIETIAIAADRPAVDRFSAAALGAACFAIPAFFLHDVPYDRVLGACLILPALAYAACGEPRERAGRLTFAGACFCAASALAVALPLAWGPARGAPAIAALVFAVAGAFAVGNARTFFASDGQGAICGS